jgi:type IV/VI secretion system ImpK/VasF family protein
MQIDSIQDETILLSGTGILEVDRHFDGSLKRPKLNLSSVNDYDSIINVYEGSENRLINSSASLLALCTSLVNIDSVLHINETRLEMSKEIISLKGKIIALDYPPTVAEHLCLLFAIVIDEIILNNKIGKDTGWENRSLVADLFGFRDGGLKFYKIVDRVLLQPKALKEVLELIYIFLKLGYQGKLGLGQEHARGELMATLEKLLDIKQIDPVPRIFGRAVIEHKNLKRPISFATKILMATLCSFAILLSSTLWFIDRRSQVDEIFNKITSAKKFEAFDYIFSSEDRQTKKRLRD